MRLLEHETKRLLVEAGIAVPASLPVRTVGEFRAVCGGPPFPQMVKAQVPAGGRPKAGGVFRAATAEEAEGRGMALWAATLRGFPVDGLLIEEPVAALEEAFLTVTYDAGAKQPVLLASRRGGVEVEAAAAPDLILLDLRLPDAHGFALAQRLRAEARMANIPILALTGYPGDQVAEALAASGCTGYLTKPISRELVLEALRHYLAPE